MSPLLELNDLWYTYPHAGPNPVAVLRGVRAEVHEGETLGIVGGNGSGKSTLLKILATLLRPTAGQLRYRGEPIGSVPTAYRAAVNYSAGAPLGFYPRLTAAENLRFFSGLKGTTLTRHGAGGLLDRVGLADQADVLYARFSLGMRQRLHLARLLLEPSALWIVDEPTNGLDADGVRLLQELLGGAPDRATVVVSHDREFLHRIGARILILKEGQVARCASLSS
ncbi:ABC transporter ATP-binding protein [Kitasatospora sp. MAP5-34]|uniref:ABC transporter ATP-binding protein n=1 Tax=Kitasatospora sp. MAP5-34 TaxID=3035102 RepID=UPI002473E33B|nr:ABC transporter ATP-binding protein [Kitasatospora sp. MAP5-34]MDH6580506.1 ABC-type multidrug transport system ATPase subunit [Kitasatospora sp. MAP5-34]